MRKLKSGLAVLALTSVCCASNKEIYPVSGKVFYKGVPATGAAVFLQRRGGDSMNEHLMMGIVQEDGSFEIVCGALGKGAPPGDYNVLIEWKSVAGQGKGRSQHGPDRLNGRYADPQKPLLHATVKAENNDLPALELTE